MKIFLIVSASFLLGVLWLMMSLVGCAFVTRFDIVDRNKRPYHYAHLPKEHFITLNFTGPMFLLYFLFWWLIIPIVGITIWTLKEHSFFQDITTLSKSFITKLVPEDPR